jgi:hypothetical protein
VSDLETRLAELCEALRNSGFPEPAEFSALSVRTAKKTALAMAEELHAALQSSSDVEVMATLPLVLGYLANVFVSCAEPQSDAATIDRVMGSATRIAHALGDESGLRSLWQRNLAIRPH